MVNTGIQPNFVKNVTGFLEKNPVIYQFLRFASIGLLNTALDFLIFNSISKALNIKQGLSLGLVEGVAFVAAVTQSYLWNRTWTFGKEQGAGMAKNFIRLLLVGILGGVAIIFVLLGSKGNAPYYYFFGILVAYLILESALWKGFGFHLSDWNHTGHSFVAFFIVTLIGLGIKVSIVSVVSVHLHLTNSDLDKNIAAVIATCVSLFWNFTGYKVIVFKK